jgi:hypothetical protein
MEKDVGYGHVDLAFLPSRIPVNFYAFNELKYIKANELNPPGLDAVALEEHRMKVIKGKWDEGLRELRKYSLNPNFATLQAEGRLKKWITIFCTHRCLVNQEIDVNDNNIEMQLCDFTWWFPPKSSVSSSISTAKQASDKAQARTVSSRSKKTATSSPKPSNKSS